MLWIKLDGKVGGKKRAAIRVTLNQKVLARLVMIQGKRTVRSGQFELKAGNRTVYVLLPKNVKKGLVNFQLLFNTAGGQKVLKTKLDAQGLAEGGRRSEQGAARPTEPLRLLRQLGRDRELVRAAPGRVAQDLDAVQARADDLRQAAQRRLAGRAAARG